MSQKKTPKFKHSTRETLREAAIFCNCCGAHFKKPPPWDSRYYPQADDAAGKGIILSDAPPTQALKKNEKLTTVNSRNGTFYFTTRH